MEGKLASIAEFLNEAVKPILAIGMVSAAVFGFLIKAIDGQAFMTLVGVAVMYYIEEKSKDKLHKVNKDLTDKLMSLQKGG